MNRQQLPTVPSFDRVDSLPFDGGLVLIKDERELIALNETARLIWQALADGATAADIASEIADRFGLPAARARADVERALKEWRGRGLFEHDPGGRASGPGRSGRTGTPPSEFALERTFALCGHPVKFRFQDAEAQRLLCPLLAPSDVHGAAASEVIDLYEDGVEHVVAVNGAEIGRRSSVEEVLELALGRVLEVSYPRARWLAIFHAGAIADDHHAIVLPGASGNGKSTLTAALAHAGFRYLSDDVAPLDGHTLHVMPVPFALSLKRGSWPVVAQWFPNLKQHPSFGDGGVARRYLDFSSSQRGSCGVPVRALVFPQHQPGARVQVTPVRPGEALAGLLQAGGWVSLDRRDLARMLDWLMVTPGYRIIYGSCDEACAAIAQICSS